MIEGYFEGSMGWYASQIEASIYSASRRGWMLPRDFRDILDALYKGYGYPIIHRGEVISYAEVEEKRRMFVLKSVFVEQGHEGNGLGKRVCTNRLNYCCAINQNKPICLICPVKKMGFYKSLGFIKQAKRNLPVELFGTRTMEEWLKSDRVWMLMPNKAYWDKFKAAKGHEG